MGLQIGLSLLLDKGEELLPDEGLCFCMYLYFYWIPLALIHICEFSKGVVLWVTLYVCTMVL